MTTKAKMESTPLPIEVTPSHDGTGAILHVNFPSDGTSERWMEGEEASTQAKQAWLWKLGCLLKIHGNIEYTFNNPWKYMLSDFPEGYKLFAVARPPQGDNPQRKDNYLSGGAHKYRSPLEFYPHLHWLCNIAQGVKDQCICQYCDHSRSQEEINKIFYLPPQKESTKGPRGTGKIKQPRRSQGLKGVTVQRGYVINRNSITSGPVMSLESGRQEQKLIGHKTNRPFL